jgi:ethanolamine ammonia-lyase large subunit
MIVNDVAGFIGPEVFRTPEQLERACLEDSVMAKLHGLTMGLDVCATFHMGITPRALRLLTERVTARAAPAYLMAVAGNADPMLGYLTTSFREHPRLRRRVGRQMTSEMQRRLNALGVVPSDSASPVASTADLYAVYAKAAGDPRASTSLADEGRRTLERLRERGYDLGRGHGSDDEDDARIDAIYSHARVALYAVLDDGVIRRAVMHPLRVRTSAADRDDYLARPPTGERIRHDDVAAVSRAYSSRRRPQVQIVISDGLNANAINEHLGTLAPQLRQLLSEAAVNVGDTDIVIQNGRVRAGYHVGELIDPEAIVHLIGERPGTGLNTMSAYLTYGRDAAARPRWSRDLDHSCTTAVCGIHRHGKPPAAAVKEIVRVVLAMLDARRSGVTLGS